MNKDAGWLFRRLGFQPHEHVAWQSIQRGEAVHSPIHCVYHSQQIRRWRRAGVHYVDESRRQRVRQTCILIHRSD